MTADAGRSIELEQAVLQAQVKARLLGLPAAGVPLGRFRLIRRLGRGATGCVYEALDPVSGARVALKLLRTPVPREIRRFKREFRELSHIAHPNLVHLYELFADDQLWYFTMELGSNVNFLNYVCITESGYDPFRLRSATLQLLSAVRALHAAGKLHCDLKPPNVLIKDESRVILLDYGLSSSRASDSQRRNAPPGGTPGYIAPELWAGQAATPESDAYAIGVMLFQALTGGLPTDLELQRGLPRLEDDAARRAIPETDGSNARLAALCRGLLAIDPRARPSIDDALRRLGVRVSEPPAPSTLPQRSHFVGRTSELAQLHRALSGVGPEHPVAVWVHGRSGIGKSKLLDRFVTEVQNRTLVLRAQCYERESLPYKAFDGIVEALTRHLDALPEDRRIVLSEQDADVLATMFPELGALLRRTASNPPSAVPVEALELRGRAFTALKRLLTELAARTTLVLVVDDLQWGDRDSARLLLELLGPPNAPALLYIGSHRDDPDGVSEFLSEIADPAQWFCDSRAIHLAPLPDALAHTLAELMLEGKVPNPRTAAARIVRESRGLPLLITELAAHLVAELGGEDPSLSLSTLLTRRMLAADSNERCILSLLSIAARPLSRTLLAAALGSSDAFENAWRKLKARSLVQSDPRGRLIVYHDQMRDEVVRQLGPSETAAFHRLLGETYERLGEGEPEWLIDHWCAAAEPERACRYAVTAAEQAARQLAFNRAAALYRTALVWTHDTATRGSLWKALGEALVNAGRGAEAADAYLQAAHCSDPSASLAFRSRAAQQLLRTGNVERAEALLEPLFAEVGLRYPRSTREVALQLFLSHLRRALPLRGLRTRLPSSRLPPRVTLLSAIFRECAIVDPLRGVLYQWWFSEHAERSGDAESIFTAFAWETYTRACLGGYRKRRAIYARLDELDVLAAAQRSSYAKATALMIRGFVSLQYGDLPQTCRTVERARAILRDECPGSTWEDAICTAVLSPAYENVGPLRAIFDDAPLLVRQANERVDQLADKVLAANMALTLLARDEPREAHAFVRERLQRVSNPMTLESFGLTMRLIDAQLYVHDGRGAWDTIRQTWQPYLRSGYDRTEMYSTFYRVRRARAALRFGLECGDRSLHGVVRSEIRTLERSSAPHVLSAVTKALRAGLAFQCDRRLDAQRLLKSSLDDCHRFGVPIAAHCIELQLGRITAGSDGFDLFERARQNLLAEGVANPERWAELYCSGFSRP